MESGSKSKTPPQQAGSRHPSYVRPQRPPPSAPPAGQQKPNSPLSGPTVPAPSKRNIPNPPARSGSLSAAPPKTVNPPPRPSSSSGVPAKSNPRPVVPARSNPSRPFSSSGVPAKSNPPRKTPEPPARKPGGAPPPSPQSARKPPPAPARQIPKQPQQKSPPPSSSASSPAAEPAPAATSTDSSDDSLRYNPLSTDGMMQEEKKEQPTVFSEDQAYAVTSASRVGVMSSSIQLHARNLSKHIAGRLGTVEQKWVPFEDRLQKDPNTPLEHTKQLTQLVRKHGVPEYLRSRFWLNVTGTAARMSTGTGLYFLLVNKYKDKHKKMMEEAAADDAAGKNHSKAVGILLQIDKDVQRTAVNGDRAQGSEGKEALRRILVTYSFFNVNVGYCQAMHKIAALFLDRFTEEESFWLLSSTIDTILPRDYFSESMIGVHTDIDTFNTLAHNVLPRLMMMLDGSGIMVDMFLSKWFMSLFIGSMNSSAVNRVLDLVFYDGSYMLFQVVLGMLKNVENDISKATAAAIAAGAQPEPLDPGTLMVRIQNMPEEVTDAQFFPIVFSVECPSKDQVDSIRKAFRAKHERTNNK